jgi:hypothetical protein
MQLQEVTNRCVDDQMQLQEVSHNLQETKCNCRKSPATCGKPNAVFHVLFGNRNGKLVFLLLDVYRFAFPETQFIKPFPSKPDFRDGDEVMAALLVTSVDFNFSGIHHGAVFCCLPAVKAEAPIISELPACTSQGNI